MKCQVGKSLVDVACMTLLCDLGIPDSFFVFFLSFSGLFHRFPVAPPSGTERLHLTSLEFIFLLLLQVRHCSDAFVIG